MSASKGSRSRDGCFNCRRRKRRCDEEKPICLSCRRTGAECIFPKSPSGSTPLKFIVATSPAHHMVPINQANRRASFLNLTPHDLATICPKFQGTDAHFENSDLDIGHSAELAWEDEGVSDTRLLRMISPFSMTQAPESLRALETALIQYCKLTLSGVPGLYPAHLHQMPRSSLVARSTFRQRITGFALR